MSMPMHQTMEGNDRSKVPSSLAAQTSETIVESESTTQYATFGAVKQAAEHCIVQPPDNVRGMKNLDRALFDTHLDLLALEIEASLCSLFLNKLGPCLLNLPRMRNIVKDTSLTEPDKRLVLLSPLFTRDDLSQLPEEARQLCTENHARVVKYRQTIGYSYFNAENIITAVLPVDVPEVTTAFETVGHLAHMNLRDCHMPYKHLIGQVVLDKNPKLRTVVNKIDNIDTTFRFFKMEVLAGASDFDVQVKENGCTFAFDYSTVYWNSRLGTEHSRLLKGFASCDVVCDMFAGVGPFVIPAGKKGLFVYGNDLNPNAYTAMVDNARRNKLSQGRQHFFCLDAREFMRKVVDCVIKDKQPMFTQVVMNLPAGAIDFLDVFEGLLKDMPAATKMPRIHCYCFSKDLNPQQDAMARVQTALRAELRPDTYSVYDVRDVAPQKRMMCVSFDLPEMVARRPVESHATVDEQQPLAKKCKQTV